MSTVVTNGAPRVRERTDEVVSAPERTPRKRRIVILAIVAAALLAAAAYLLTRIGGPSPIEGSGTLEMTESDVASKVQGRLTALRVADGDRVRAGQLLAVLEDTDPGFDLRGAQANVASASAQVAAAQAAYDLQAATYGSTVAEAGAGVAVARSGVGEAGENLFVTTRAATLAIDQARAQVIAADAAFAHARIDVARTRALVGTGDMAQQTLDDAVNAVAGARAQVVVAQDALALAEANRHEIEIRRFDVQGSQAQHRASLAALATATAQRASVAQRAAQLAAAEAARAQARAVLGSAQDRVHETRLLAPFDGIVVDHNNEVGDLVQPGAAVLTIGNAAHPYAYVYVSESDLPHVKTGTRARTTVDGMPDRMFDGTVTEIATTAEFTPENVQTKDERIEYLVFRVKVQFSDATGTLKAGLPVDVVFPR